MNKTPINDRLKKIRLSKSMTQHQMAEFVGVPFRTYQSWEIGDRTPTAGSMRLLEELLEREKNQ